MIDTYLLRVLKTLLDEPLASLPTVWSAASNGAFRWGEGEGRGGDFSIDGLKSVTQALSNPQLR